LRVFDVPWLRFLPGSQLPTAVIVAVSIVLALSALIRAATPLVAIILHKFRPEPGRRIQVERGRLKIVIEPPAESKDPADAPKEPDKQLAPVPEEGARRRKQSASSPAARSPRRADRAEPS
jgi:hypothetical protein